ncbi:MAG: guanylate kinase [Woeseiaceae bacterium]
MSNRAGLFVIAAPSGAGKTTLVKELVERKPELRFSISYTTREKRVTEVEAKDYFFVPEAEFQKLEKRGELLESALVFDNHYGTSRSQVEQHLNNGHHVILEIDWQGAQQVRQSKPDCITLFVLPPSRDELERRLRDRRTDSDTVIERRLNDAFGDMSHWNEFDYVIINDDLTLAVTELESILNGEGDANRVGNESLQARVEKIIS